MMNLEVKCMHCNKLIVEMKDCKLHDKEPFYILCNSCLLVTKSIIAEIRQEQYRYFHKDKGNDELS